LRTLGEAPRPRAYLTAAQEPDAAEALELQRRAAEQPAERARGRGCGAATRLEQVGLKLALTPRRAILSYLIRRFQLRLRGLSFRERPASEIPVKDLIRIDTCWSASSGLSFMDTIRGRDFQMRHMLLALKAGEPYRVARAMFNEAGYSALPGWPVHERTQRIVSTAMSLARRVDHPHALAMAHIGAGISAYLEGRWEEAWELALQSEQILRSSAPSRFRARHDPRVFAQGAHLHGPAAELSERLPKILKEAMDLADLAPRRACEPGTPTS
jgi:hypothetical protein